MAYRIDISVVRQVAKGQWDRIFSRLASALKQAQETLAATKRFVYFLTIQQMARASATPADLFEMVLPLCRGLIVGPLGNHWKLSLAN